MASPVSGDRSQFRGVVLSEDKRTRRFFRQLLRSLGFDQRKIIFETAPSGDGSAENWVRLRYPAEVQVLRSKAYQKNLFLVAVRDGDGKGLTRRKAELDQELKKAGLAAREKQEKIATPVPTRNIETWLLSLLGDAKVNESWDFKAQFEAQHGGRERVALRNAARAWSTTEGARLPSLADGAEELARIDE